MKVASGLAQGRHPEPALAGAAVAEAMARADLGHARAVLLYLSAEFAHDPQPAITAAARAAQCLQVAGCTAAGVFSDADWVLDAPAAAALVLGDGLSLQTAGSREEPSPRLTSPLLTSPLLTYAAPNALDMHWLMSGGARFGGVSGDASGQGPYSVWSGGHAHHEARCELALAGCEVQVGVTQGIRPLTQSAPVQRSVGNELLQVGGLPALTSLVRELPLSQRGAKHLPSHSLMAGVTYGEPLGALEEGRFHLLPVLSVDEERRSVTIVGPLPAGTEIFWAQRQPRAAEQDLARLLERMAQARNDPPRFGLVFSCMARGPLFYGGVDRDLRLLKERFPAMPFIGFYGNGEIAHRDGANRLLQSSLVLGLGHEVCTWP